MLGNVAPLSLKEVEPLKKASEMKFLFDINSKKLKYWLKRRKLYSSFSSLEIWNLNVSVSISSLVIWYNIVGFWIIGQSRFFRFWIITLWISSF